MGRNLLIVFVQHSSTDNGRPGIQPILSQVQPILFHGGKVSLAEIVVHRIIAPFMMCVRSQQRRRLVRRQMPVRKPPFCLAKPAKVATVRLKWVSGDEDENEDDLKLNEHCHQNGRFGNDGVDVWPAGAEKSSAG